MTDPEEEVRRRLAAARHTDPIPDEVVGRLSDRLAELPMPSTSDELAAVRRRRAATLLVAAAAVVVAGIGAGALFGPGLSGDESADTAGTAASAPVSEAEEAGDGGQGEGPAADQDAAPRAELDDQRADGLVEEELSATLTTPGNANRAAVIRLTVVDADAAAPVRLRRGGLADRVRRVARQVETTPTAAVLDPAESADLLASYGCGPGRYGDGHLVPARYAGQPAVLALRPPVGGTRIAEVLACGSTEPLRSLTVPVD